MESLLKMTASALLVAAGTFGVAVGETLTRGPYVQMVTPSSAVVRWRTDAAVTGRVRYGAQVSTLTSSKDESAATTEHEISIPGLTSKTKYYYSVGNATASIAGADTNHYLVTAPSAGTANPSRVWVVADFGQGSYQPQTTASFVAYNKSTHADLVLSLGDQAEEGTDAEYQQFFFDPLKSVLRNSPVYAAMGNHDRDPTFTLSLFTFPKAAEMGGSASGVETYYSFDYANIHFICLCTEISDCAQTGAQNTWLKKDLAATTQTWKVAFMHRSIHSGGYHATDGSSSCWQTVILPTLEQGGIDLVLSGHNHIYERSFLIDGLYGSTSTLVNANKIDAGLGPYRKAPGSRKGEILMTVQGAGVANDPSYNQHYPIFVATADDFEGSVILDVNGSVLRSAYLDRSGAVRDTFSITKSAGTGTVSRPIRMTLTDVNGAGDCTISGFESGDRYEYEVLDISGRLVAASRGAMGQDGSAHVSLPASIAKSKNGLSFVRVRAHQTASVTKIVRQ